MPNMPNANTNVGYTPFLESHFVPNFATNQNNAISIPNPGNNIPNNTPPSSSSTTVAGKRKVLMEEQMFLDFMKISNLNTQRKIETCGILAGTIV